MQEKLAIKIKCRVEAKALVKIKNLPRGVCHTYLRRFNNLRAFKI